MRKLLLSLAVAALLASACGSATTIGPNQATHEVHAFLDMLADLGRLRG
jgi:uncharacterized protein YceK